jgi:hypothetical protein
LIDLTDLGHEHARRVRPRGASGRRRASSPPGSDVARRGSAPHVAAPTLVHLGVGDVLQPAARVAHRSTSGRSSHRPTVGQAKPAGMCRVVSSLSVVPPLRSRQRGEDEAELPIDRSTRCDAVLLVVCPGNKTSPTHRGRYTVPAQAQRFSPFDIWQPHVSFRKIISLL